MSWQSVSLLQVEFAFVRPNVFLVLIGAIGLTVSVALAVRDYGQTAEVERWRLEHEVDNHFNIVTSHLAARESLASVVALMFKPPPGIRAHALAEIDTRFLHLAPDIHSLTWIPRAGEQEAAQVIAVLRRMGIENPQLMSKAHSPIDRELLAPEFFPLLDIEPKTPEHLSLIGVVVSSSPIVRDAMEKARETGVPAATPPFTSAKFQESAAVVLYAPVSRRSGDSKAALLGYLGFAYRLDRLIGTGISSSPDHRLALRIYDAAAPGAGDIYDSGAASAWRQPSTGQPHRIVRAVQFGGRPWIAEYSSAARPGSLAWASAIRTAVIGVAAVLAMIGFAAYLSSVSARLQAALAARTAAEERSRTVIRELNHRVKNTLTMVQAIIQRTLTRGADIDRARESLTSRVVAMASATQLLSDAEWRGVGLRELVSAANLPFSERLCVSGPDFRLTPLAAQNMALLVHELCTNAAKYGALSSASGSVALDWRIEGGTFRLTWNERDGPRAEEPQRLGFGRQLVEKIVPAAIGGSAHFAFDRRGLRYELEAPARSVAAADGPALRPYGAAVGPLTHGGPASAARDPADRPESAP